MMALHHRKILFAGREKPSEFDKRFSSDCYVCYICPKNCYMPSPPPQSPTPDNPQKNHVSTAVILMLCMLGVSFLVLSYLTIARYRSRNSRRSNPEFLEHSRADFLAENQGSVLDHPIWYIRTVGLPQSVIDSIALFPYKKGDGLIDGHDCSVCLNDFQENERLRLLPKCSHAFHVGCIDTWLRSHKTCPVCRAPILIGNSNNARLSRAESSGSSESIGENQGENESENPGEIESSGESRGATPTQEDRTAKIPLESKTIRVLSDLADHCRVRVDQYQELRSVRRSISMDFSSALTIYRPNVDKKGEGCSATKLETIDKQNSYRRGCKNCSICRVIKSCSCNRPLQKGPVSMKRSFSFGGKRSPRKNSRSLESIQIPENIW